MSQRVFILLPVHNRRDVTARFLDCLKKQTFLNIHLVLVDDGSKDGTEDMVRSAFPSEHLTVLKGRGDWWWAGSLQQGIKRLEQNSPEPSDVVLIINDDVSFEKTFIEKGGNELEKYPQTLLLAKEFDSLSKNILETGLHADHRQLTFSRAESPSKINCLSTRGVFMRWDVLTHIGGFYPRFLPHYGSDYEFTIRAGRKGFSLRTSDNVYLIPDPSATGVREITEGTGILGVLRILFDKKSVMNPVYRTSYILLVSPKRYIPGQIIKEWARAGRHILKSFKGGRKQ